MEKQLNFYSWRNPTRLGEAENPARRVQGPDHLPNDETCVSNAEKVKNNATRLLEWHWTFLGPGSEEKWYGSSDHARKWQWNCTAAKMVQRFKETGHLVFKSISALSRGILKQMNGKTSITELLFQTIHSVNQLSVYGAVANWCYLFGSTEEEKGRACIPVDNTIFDQVETRRSTTLGISSDKSIWKQDARKSPELRRAGWEDTTDTIMWKKLTSNILMQPGIVQSSTKWRRRMGNNYSFVPRIFDFSILSASPSFGSYSWRHHHRTSLGSSFCENSWRLWSRSCDSINCKSNVHIWRCYIQRNRTFCEWNSWSRRGPVTNCSQNFKDQYKVNHVKNEQEARATRKLVPTLSAIRLKRASMYTQRTILTNERTWKVIHAHSPDGGK